MEQRARHWWLVALTVLVALVAAACGDDGDDQAQTDQTSTTVEEGSSTSAPAVTVDGCGEDAYTDQADRSSSRPIARCEPGAPAPQPLSERITIKLAAATKGEYLAPVLLGIARGEFEKENLEIELIQLPFADAVAQMGQGGIDAAHGGPFAAFVNGVASGSDIKWVMGNYSPPDGGDLSVPQSGLWVRRDAFSNPDDPDLSELKEKSLRVANSAGAGTSAIYWLERAFAEAGISYGDVNMQVVPPADQVAAMQNEAVHGAFLLDPFWRQAAADPETFALVAVQPREPNGGIFFGPNLTQKNPEAGVAFARAYIRTINTYLDGNYKQDAELMADLAEAIGGVEPAALTQGTPLVFEWELREGVMDELQPLYIKYGSVTGTSTPLPESQLVDRSFYAKAVGATEN